MLLAGVHQRRHGRVVVRRPSGQQLVAKGCTRTGTRSGGKWHSEVKAKVGKQSGEYSVKRKAKSISLDEVDADFKTLPLIPVPRPREAYLYGQGFRLPHIPHTQLIQEDEAEEDV